MPQKISTWRQDAEKSQALGLRQIRVDEDLENPQDQRKKSCETMENNGKP